MALAALTPLFPITISGSSNDKLVDITEFIVGAQYIITLTYPVKDDDDSFFNNLMMPLILKIKTIPRAEYVRIKEEYMKILQIYFTNITEKIKECNSSNELITFYKDAWTEFKIMILCSDVVFTDVFKDFKRITVKTLKIISEFCYQQWYEQLLLPNNQTISESIHKLMFEFRESMLCDETNINARSTIKEIINCYKELDPTLQKEYEESWSKPFLVNTRAYYEKKCEEYFQNNSITGYIHFCNKILDIEQIVANEFLAKTTIDQHQVILNEVIILKYKDVIQEEVNKYIKDNMLTELKYIYRLFVSTDLVNTLVEIFADEYKKDIIRTFDNLLPQYIDAKDPKQKAAFPKLYCESFLEKYNYYNKIAKDAFVNLKFMNELEKISRDVINENAINKKNDPTEISAVLVGVYARDLVGNEKILNKEFIDLHLDNIMNLYNLIYSKDVFCKRYKTLLSNRLLKHSQNQDNEFSFISAVQKKDISFANSLGIMMRDYIQSQEKYGSESGFLTVTSTVPFKVTPIIITSSFWPLSETDKTITMKLPSVLEAASTMFCNKYSSLNSGKVIQWIHEKSSVLLDMKLGGKTYKITMNHFQAAIILALSKRPVLSEEQLFNETEIPMAWINATIKSLIELRLIQYNNSTKQCRINQKFSANMILLVANGRFVRPVVEEVVDKEIEEHRCFNTQAAIVRIMKARRILEHSVLCEEVTKQTSRFFPQNINRIKIQICKLIDGTEKYLERVDNKTYKYVTE